MLTLRFHSAIEEGSLTRRGFLVYEQWTVGQESVRRPVQSASTLSVAAPSNNTSRATPIFIREQQSSQRPPPSPRPPHGHPRRLRYVFREIRESPSKVVNGSELTVNRHTSADALQADLKGSAAMHHLTSLQELPRSMFSSSNQRTRWSSTSTTAQQLKSGLQGPRQAARIHPQGLVRRDGVFPAAPEAQYSREGPGAVAQYRYWSWWKSTAHVT